MTRPHNSGLPAARRSLQDKLVYVFSCLPYSKQAKLFKNAFELIKLTQVGSCGATPNRFHINIYLPVGQQLKGIKIGSMDVVCHFKFLTFWHFECTFLYLPFIFGRRPSILHCKPLTNTQHDYGRDQRQRHVLYITVLLTIPVPPLQIIYTHQNKGRANGRALGYSIGYFTGCGWDLAPFTQNGIIFRPQCVGVFFLF